MRTDFPAPLLPMSPKDSPGLNVAVMSLKDHLTVEALANIIYDEKILSTHRPYYGLNA